MRRATCSVNGPLQMTVDLVLGFIPPYGSMVGILSLLCVCTVTDFTAADKDSGVKLCMLLRLLSGISFSHFGELWPRGGSSRSLYTNGTWEKIAPGWEKIQSHLGKKFPGEAQWAVRIGRRMAGYASCLQMHLLVFVSFLTGASLIVLCLVFVSLHTVIIMRVLDILS